MIPALTTTILLYAGLVAVSATVVAARRIPRPSWLQAGGWMLQVLLVLQGVVAVLAVVNGSASGDSGMFLAYVAASVVILPVTASMTTSAGSARTAHDIRLAVAGVLLVVVQYRLIEIWSANGR